MSSYGSMSPCDEGFERYEPPLFCQPTHQGSPMDRSYWPVTNTENEFEGQEFYHDGTHYIGRGYGYEDNQVATNEPYDAYQHSIPHTEFIQNVTGMDCDLQPLLRYDRPTPPSYIRVVKRRTTANKKERRRTQSINTAFSDLRECIPNVPPDTKLSKMVRKRSQSINLAFSSLRERIPNVLPDTKMSKIKTLRLATSYISYLLKVLESDGEPAGGFRAELHHTPPRRRNVEHSNQANSSEKRGKGRTGWPQHVWALELKSEQNLST